MPHQVCSRCQRANPGEAAYCFYDGVPLGHGTGAASAGLLPHEFVFKSGRRCRTFDDLVQTCYEEWDDARELLHRGEFARFLTRAGRADLARSAQETQGQSDPDMRLVNFLQVLPTTQTQQPRLELNPRRLMLGVLRIGEAKQFKVTIANSGRGTLQGKVAVTEGAAWLKIDGGDGQQCLVNASRDQVVALRVQTAGLMPQSYSGKLTVMTNGGIAEVPVRLDLTAVPFAQGPFKGAATPRDLAEKMRKHPKAAAPLLESGEVARWFTANGWAYPVAGPPAPGVAAVQQFFECMGLSKPPPLQLSETAFNYVVVPPEIKRDQVTLRTTAKKWVYAQANSDRPWLRITTPVGAGPQQTQFAFEVDSSLMQDNQVHEGTVQLIANAGQKLSVRVVVEVRRPAKSWGWQMLSGSPAKPTTPVAAVPASAPVAQVAPVPVPTLAARNDNDYMSPVENVRPKQSLSRWLLRPFFVTTFVFMFLRVFLVPVADLLARPVWDWLAHTLFGEHGPAALPALERWTTAATTEDAYLKVFVLSTFWIGSIVGLITVAQRRGRWTDYFCGVIAGMGAGMAVSATLACLISAGDWAPRLLLWMLTSRLKTEPSAWLVAPAYIVLACVWWTVFGAALGVLLTILGPLGARVVDLLGAPFAWLFRLCGLNRLASLFCS